MQTHPNAWLTSLGRERLLPRLIDRGENLASLAAPLCAGAVHGEVPASVWPVEDSDSPRNGFRGPCHGSDHARQRRGAVVIRKTNQPTDNNHQGTMNTPMNPFNQFRSEHPLSAMEP